LEPRGFLSCLGLRKTVGSSDLALPPERKALLENFNRLYTVLSEEEFSRNKNPPLLT
jgi:hypothetical protein